MRVLIAGCGDVGSTLAAALLQDGHAVYGLKRNPSTLPAGVRAVQADLTVTFVARKRGFDRPGSAAWTGRVVVAGIGVPFPWPRDPAPAGPPPGGP